MTWNWTLEQALILSYRKYILAGTCHIVVILIFAGLSHSCLFAAYLKVVIYVDK